MTLWVVQTDGHRLGLGLASMVNVVDTESGCHRYLQALRVQVKHCQVAKGHRDSEILVISISLLVDVA